MTGHLRRAAAAVAALAILGVPAPAAASGTPWLRADGGLPLFDVTNLAPGDSGSRELVIDNPADGPVTVTVGVVNLRTDDAGCTEPERAAGDRTCGAGGGELQRALRLTLSTADGRPLRGGTLDSWTGEAPDETTIPAGGSRAYLVAYDLPRSTGNLVQSDRVSFDLRIRLDGAGQEEIVPALPELPVTGVAADRLAAVGLLLVAGGVVTLIVTRVRNRRHLTRRR